MGTDRIISWDVTGASSPPFPGGRGWGLKFKGAAIHLTANIHTHIPTHTGCSSGGRVGAVRRLTCEIQDEIPEMIRPSALIGKLPLTC